MKLLVCMVGLIGLIYLLEWVIVTIYVTVGNMVAVNHDKYIVDFTILEHVLNVIVNSVYNEVISNYKTMLIKKSFLFYYSSVISKLEEYHPVAYFNNFDFLEATAKVYIKIHISNFNFQNHWGIEA